jgi:hypothetical protein
MAAVAAALASCALLKTGRVSAAGVITATGGGLTFAGNAWAVAVEVALLVAKVVVATGAADRVVVASRLGNVA